MPTQENSIGEGDFVDVFFDHFEPEFRLRVLGIPCATGDSWRLRRDDGTIVYVQTFTKMLKRQSGPF